MRKILAFACEKKCRWSDMLTDIALPTLAPTTVHTITNDMGMCTLLQYTAVVVLAVEIKGRSGRSADINIWCCWY